MLFPVSDSEPINIRLFSEPLHYSKPSDAIVKSVQSTFLDNMLQDHDIPPQVSDTFEHTLVATCPGRFMKDDRRMYS